MARTNKDKLGAKAEAEIHNAMAELTLIDIDDRDVLDAYAQIYEHLRHHPKGSTLLTLDRDFDPLDGAMITRLYIDSTVK